MEKSTPVMVGKYYDTFGKCAEIVENFGIIEEELVDFGGTRRSCMMPGRAH